MHDDRSVVWQTLPLPLLVTGTDDIRLVAPIEADRAAYVLPEPAAGRPPHRHAAWKM